METRELLNGDGDNGVAAANRGKPAEMRTSHGNAAGMGIIMEYNYYLAHTVHNLNITKSYMFAVGKFRNQKTGIWPRPADVAKASPS